MQINYYNKYLKYKKKYVLMKKKLGGANKRHFDINYPHYDELTEAQMFKKNNLKSTLESKEYFIEPEIKNKFVISSHGALLTNTHYNKIKVPENFTIYFNTTNGETCEIDEGTDQRESICNDDKEFINMFKNVSYGLKNTQPIENREIYWNKRWVQKYIAGNIIYECVLNGDTQTNLISSNISFCSTILGLQIIYELKPKSDYLLSQLLFYIMKYIKDENIEPPYNIFCSFCLDNDNSLYEEKSDKEESDKEESDKEESDKEESDKEESNEEESDKEESNEEESNEKESDEEESDEEESNEEESNEEENVDIDEYNTFLNYTREPDNDSNINTDDDYSIDDINYSFNTYDINSINNLKTRQEYINDLLLLEDLPLIYEDGRSLISESYDN